MLDFIVMQMSKIMKRAIEKTYETIKTDFDHIFKHPEVRQNPLSTTCCIFHSLPAFLKCDQPLSLVFEIILLSKAVITSVETEEQHLILTFDMQCM